MYSTAAVYRRDSFHSKSKRGLPRTDDMLLNQRVKYSSSFEEDNDLLVDAVELTQWERTNQLLSEITSAVLRTADRLRKINTTVVNLLDKDDVSFKKLVTADQYKTLRTAADKMSALAQDYEQDRQDLLALSGGDEPPSTRVLTEELVLVMGNSATTLRQYVVNVRLVFSRVEQAQDMGGQFLTTISGDELWESRTKFYEYAL